MTNTLYSLDALGTPTALFAALLIGFGFGFALERAGFSSSRRLAGVFYFKDMAVVKVMFTALVTAMLGLSYLVAAGWIRMDQIFLMPTIYGAQIVGGLLFGAGFVMGGWCPGTAAAGMAAGRIDALVFLVGTIGGSVLFNELFPLIGGLYTAGDSGVLMLYDSLGISRNVCILAFTLVAVGAFWLSEWAEKASTGRSAYLGSPFLKAFSVALVALAAGLFVISPVTSKDPLQETETGGVMAFDEQALMVSVEEARDHIEPEELADRLMAGDPGLVVVDIRPAAEFNTFHIRGAINVSIEALAEALKPHENSGTVVLYSNGMTHPAQARDSLQRQGFNNVYILTDGLQGFRDRCLKPVSLRHEPLTESQTVRVNVWRKFFAEAGPAVRSDVVTMAAPALVRPTLVETDWLAAQIGDSTVKVIDLRLQPEYNTAHIPGAISLNVESLRGNIGGVPSVLLPVSMLAEHFSLLGIRPTDTVVLVSGDKFHDATLAGMALERLGHASYAILNGTHAKWALEGRLLNAILPVVNPAQYPAKGNADYFTVDCRIVAANIGKPGTVILDVRPAEFFTGKKSEEARAGHIPGAINRPFTEDVVTASNKVATLKPLDVLATEYAKIIPSINTEIIVHCRTGHQASQTFFVLKHLLGYPNVRWYDGGWTEWATRQELPVVDESKLAVPAK